MTQLIEMFSKELIDNIPRIIVDGQPLGTRRLRMVDHWRAPFTRVYIDEEPQFETEVWIDGSIRHLVPKKTEWSMAIYDRIENEILNPTLVQRSHDLSAAQEQMKRVQGLMHLSLADANFDRWETVRRMRSLWTRNAEQLIALLSRLSDDKILAIQMVQSEGPEDIRDAINLELDLCIYNYLSSAISLVEVTRILLRAYKGSEFWQRYDKLKEVITSKKSFHFVSSLRNYTVHYALPLGGHQLSWARGDDTLRSMVTANRDSLLKFENWTPMAKEFLLESNELIDLSALFREHVAIFSSEWEWIVDQFQGLHRTELFIRNELAAEWNWLLTSGSSGQPRRDWIVPPKYLSDLKS